MSSLFYCIQKLLAKVSPEEKKILEQSAESYRNEGYKKDEPNLMAVKDYIKDLEAELESILDQIKGIDGHKYGDGSIEIDGVKFDFANNLKTIKDVDVFAVGTWIGANSPPEGDTYDQKDLESIIDAFNSGAWKPNIKITHGRDKEQIDVGKVTNLRMKGKKLFADFENIPHGLYELMKKGLFKKRSSEVVWNLKDKAGKVWPRVLKAVALLAPGQNPAVGVLKEGYDFEAVYCYEVKPSDNRDHAVKLMEFFESKAADVTLEELDGALAHIRNKKKKREGNQMALEDLMKKYGVETEEELDKILADADEAKKRVDAFEKKKATDKKAEVQKFIDQAKASGRVLPRDEDTIQRMFEDAMDDEEKLENLKTFIDGLPKDRVDFKEKSKSGDDKKEHDSGNRPSDEVDRLAKEYVKEGKAKDYDSALKVVEANHKDLWESYLVHD